MRHRVLVLVVLGLLGFAARSSAQQFVVVGTDARQYPVVKTRIVGLDNAGAVREIGGSELTVTDNGQPVTNSSVTCATSQGTPVSVMVACDVSTSMGTGPTSALSLATSAARAIEPALRTNADEIGLLQYDAQARLLYGLTNTRTGYSAAVDNLTLGSGSSLSEAFSNVPFGVLSQLQNARNLRAVILMTDGATSFDAAMVLATCKTFRIKVFVIGLKSTVSPDLRMLADSSGGSWSENITTADEAVAHARAYTAAARLQTTCTLEWRVNNSCLPAHSIAITGGAITRILPLTTPASLITALVASRQSINFGEIMPGLSQETDVVLSAQNGDVTVNQIGFDDTHFVLLNAPAVPFVIRKDETKTLRVRFTTTDSSIVIGHLISQTNACTSDTVFARGGFFIKDNLLRITAPNGGETLTAGVPTQISWTGTIPSDLIRLELTTDNGSTWSSISESAGGNRYTWTPGPGTSNGQAKVRGERTVLDASKIVILTDNREPLYSANFTLDGSQVLTGCGDGTVRLFDAATGNQIRLVGTHTDWVTCIAVHPTLPIAATASLDGTVRVWDYSTGQRIENFLVGPKVWSVAFNASGSMLYIGAEKLIQSVQTANWSVQSSTVETAGIVYSIQPVGDAIAVAEGTIATLRNGTSLSEMRRFVAGDKEIYSVAITPDGKTLATGSADKIIRTYNLQTAALVKQTEPLTGSVVSLQYDPTGQHLLSTGADVAVMIHDAATLSVLNYLPGHTGKIYTVRYDKSGRHIVTASTDKTARVWDVQLLRKVIDISDAAFSIVGGAGVPQNVSMGDVALGSGVDRVAAVLRNTSAQPLNVSSIRLVTGKLSDFELVNPVVPTTIAPFDTLNVDIAFRPSELGVAIATMQIQTGTGTHNIDVQGVGVRPALQSPSVINFGRLIASDQSRDSTVTIQLPTGVSGSTITVTDVSLVGPQSSQFLFVDANGNQGFTLNDATRSHTIALRFKPTQFGRFPSQLVLTTAGGSKHVIRLYGEGTGDAAIQSSIQLSIPTDACASQNYAGNIGVKNTGNSVLTVYAAGIEGNSASEFTIGDGKTFPLDIPAKDSVVFEVKFTPGSTGLKQAKAVFTTNAINAPFGKTTVQIITRKDSVGFEFSRTDVAFLNVPDKKTATQRILLLNTGTIPLRWPRGPINVNNDFTIESVTPDITPANQQSEVTIRFNGGAAGSNPTGSYTFTDSVCGRSVELTFRATVKQYIGATIRVDSVSANTGATVDVPVYITDKVNFDRTNVQNIRLYMSTNATLLSITSQASDVAVRGDTVLTFNVLMPIPNQGDLMGTLSFKTFWGNDTMAVIRIDSVAVLDTILVTVDPGAVRMADLCRAGGIARLIYGTAQAAAVRVAPNPPAAGGQASVQIMLSERGITTLQLADVTGRIVSVLIEGNLVPGTYDVPLPQEVLHNGTYFLVLTTPTEIITNRLNILK